MREALHSPPPAQPPLSLSRLLPWAQVAWEAKPRPVSILIVFSTSYYFLSPFPSITDKITVNMWECL